MWNLRVSSCCRAKTDAFNNVQHQYYTYQLSLFSEIPPYIWCRSILRRRMKELLQHHKNSFVFFASACFSTTLLLCSTRSSGYEIIKENWYVLAASKASMLHLFYISQYQYARTLPSLQLWEKNKRQSFWTLHISTQLSFDSETQSLEKWCRNGEFEHPTAMYLPLNLLHITTEQALYLSSISTQYRRPLF